MPYGTCEVVFSQRQMPADARNASQLNIRAKNKITSSFGSKKSGLVRIMQVIIACMSMVVTKAMVPQVIVGHISYSDQAEIDGAIGNAQPLLRTISSPQPSGRLNSLPQNRAG